MPPRGSSLIVAGLTILVLLPFVNKAFHIDDALFLAVARQIGESPLKPYDFSYNWFGTPLPMWQVTQNPPLNSYLLAAVESVARGREVVYHLAYLMMAAGCSILMLGLASLLCRWPLAAVGLAVACPAFLVSATNVMADIPLLFFWLLAVRFTLRAVENGREANLWWAGLSAAAAVMTKYFGVALVPLLAAYWLLRRRRASVHLAALGLPLAALTAWTLYARIMGGVLHPLSSAGYAVEVSGRLSPAVLHAGNTLAFLGGTLVWPVLSLPVLILSRTWTSVSIGVAVTAMASACLSLLPPDARPLWILLVAGGTALTATVVVEWRRRPDPETTLLALWFLGTATFVMFFNWTVTARALLPAVFPASILLLRRLESSARPRWLGYVKATALPTLGLSLVLAFADAELANASRDFACTTARTLRQRVESLQVRPRLSFIGHWGFQYYMEREGIPPQNVRRPPEPGDLVFVAHNSSNVGGIQRIPRVTRFDRVVPSSFWLHTMNALSHAGFYSTVAGPLPFAPAAGHPADRLAVFEVVPTDLAPEIR